MQKRRLGSSDLYITPIGLGAWPFGGGGWRGGWGPQDDAESLRTIDRAMELGINWIDVAPYYGLGHAEEIVGKAIAGRRDKVLIATKCGLVWDEGSTKVYGQLKADSIRCQVEASLRRLNTDVIDLLQIHYPDPAEDIAEAWTTIAQLIREGKVRYGGVSNFTVDQHRCLHTIHPITSSQPVYSMILRNIEQDVLPYCAANDIGVIVYWVIMGGLLTGKFTRERAANLPEDDWRQGRHFFVEPELSANLQLVEGLRRIAGRNNRTVAQLATAWTLKTPEVTAAILGARRPAQIEETVDAAEWILSSDDLAEIESLLERRKRSLPSGWVDHR